MSFCLPCGLTVEQVVQALGEAADMGLVAIGQAEFVPLVQAAEKLVQDAAADIANLTAGNVLRTEVDAEQAAGAAAETAKFGKESGTKP